MSLLALAVGVAVAFAQPLRRALLAAVAVWVVTTAFLVAVADAGHEPDAGFWTIQLVLLAAALGATWGAAQVRGRRPSRM